jgi:hypothetical protein
MLKAVDFRAVKFYSLKADVGEPKTIFKLGHIDSGVRARILDGAARAVQDGSAKAEGRNVRLDLLPASLCVEFVRHGLKGWENFPAEFSTVTIDIPGLGPRSVVSEDALNVLQWDWLVEIASEIMSLNTVEGDDLKN